MFGGARQNSIQDLLVQDSIAAAGFGTRVPRHCLLEFWIEFLAFNFNVFLLGELVRNEWKWDRTRGVGVYTLLISRWFGRSWKRLRSEDGWKTEVSIEILYTPKEYYWLRHVSFTCRHVGIKVKMASWFAADARCSMSASGLLDGLFVFFCWGRNWTQTNQRLNDEPDLLD